MRISEIAALVGVTTRAVRHYHHLGLLPEPARLANGYRQYSVRDAVALARIRRLTELGLGLDEVRDVIADDAGHELVDVLGELDADLARQEAEIRDRRARLSMLLARARQGRLTTEDELSPNWPISSRSWAPVRPHHRWPPRTASCSPSWRPPRPPKSGTG